MYHAEFGVASGVNSSGGEDCRVFSLMIAEAIKKPPSVCGGGSVTVNYHYQTARDSGLVKRPAVGAARVFFICYRDYTKEISKRQRARGNTPAYRGDGVDTPR